MTKMFPKRNLLFATVFFLAMAFTSHGLLCEASSHEDSKRFAQMQKNVAVEKASNVHGEAAKISEDKNSSIPLVWWLTPFGALCALYFVRKFYKEVMAYPEGDKKMVEIAGHVRDGAYAYLKQQYKVVFIFFMFVFVLLLYISFGLKVQSTFVPFAFLTSGFFSGLA